jgi:flagellar L-ring protein precursor FlgH
VKQLVRLRWAALASTLLAAVSANPSAHAESLWERRDPARAFLFFDTNARHKGDQLTVIIEETTGVENSEARALSKESAASKSMDVDSSASGDFGGPVGAAAFDFNSDSNRSFDGDASFSSQREVSTRMAATVTDVLPNGNLVIKGEKNVVVAGDERIMIISGIVRPYDVTPGNTVSSRNIAQWRITYDGHGQEQSFVRQGYFSRLMNKLWPF